MEKLFIQAGLNNNEAKIYKTLLEKGGLLGGEISQITGLKRGLVYKTLKELKKKNLVSEDKKGKSAVFFPGHPETLKNAIKEQEEKIKKTRKEIENELPKIIKNFNLSSRANIKHFEGQKAVNQILNDAILNNSQKEIYSFVDLEQYLNYFNRSHTTPFTKKRSQKQIKKKIITPQPANSKLTQKYIAKTQPLTKVAFSNAALNSPQPKNSKLNIYDNKVSFLDMSPRSPQGIIIESPEIFKTLKALFLGYWNLAGQKI